MSLSLPLHFPFALSPIPQRYQRDLARPRLLTTVSVFRMDGLDSYIVTGLDFLGKAQSQEKMQPGLQVRILASSV